MISRIVMVFATAFTLFCYTPVTASSPCVEYSPKVVLRSTVRLYWGNECITLYRGGKLLLTMGDNVAVEGTYSIEDEGN